MIAWLASYPRSGNTWMRCLLHGYVAGPGSADDVRRTVPDIHTDDPLDEAVAVKTHSLAGPDHPHWGDTDRIVYLIRDPVGVCHSALRYWAVPPEEQRMNLDLLLRWGGAASWVEAGFGGWHDHVAAWMGQWRDHPILLVRYEQLLADPRAQLDRVARFLWGASDPRRLDRAVAWATRPTMQELEAGDDHVFLKPRQNGTFVSDGTTPDKLDAGLARLYRDTPLGQAARVMGYA